MELAFIKQLADIMVRSDLDELDYAAGGVRVRLYRGARGDATDGGAVSARVPDRVTDSMAAAPAAPDRPAEPRRHTVRAGLVGSFFRAAGPDQPAFVRVGDFVQEGQTMALIEAMKVLNAVEADAAGKLVEVLAEDGAQVEAGTPLFLLEPGAEDV